MSVDARTKGRKLDGYTVRRIDGHEVLLDPDLLKLPVELTITSGGVFGRSRRRAQRRGLPHGERCIWDGAIRA